MLKKRFYTISRLCLILALSLLVSCVGTVQDSKVDINSLSEEDKELISFPGLEKAVGISHDKVELEFTPLGTTDPNVKYFLYINGSQSPIEINPSSLDDALAGRKRYLVSGLNINNSYKFKLKIKNALTNAESKSEKELVAQTFDNKTSDFKGITSVTKVTGLSATSVFLEWVPAHMDGVIIGQGFDPIYYEVTVIGAGGAQNLNNPNYTGLNRRVIKVPDPTTTQISPTNHSDYTSILIDGLTPATTHYFQVRSVNKLWYNFSIDPLVSTIPVSREANTKFLKLKTDPATGLFDFNRDSLRLTNAPGLDAFNKINTFWSPGIGTFSGYRIFLRKYPNPSASLATVLGDDRLSDEQMQKVLGGDLQETDANGFSVKANTTKTSLQIQGLDTYQWYQVKIIQCKNTACPVFGVANEANIGIVSELRAIRVQPSLAPFDGISRIDNPKDSSGLDEITVSFDPPTLSVGYADTLEVYCLESGAPNAAYDPIPLSTSAKANSTVNRCKGLKLTDTPQVTDNKIIIKGVKSIPTSSAADSTYCFAIFPAIRNQDEKIPLTNTYPTSDWVVRCITPEVKPPTVVQFEGLKGTCNPIQNTIATNWVAPTGGLYANYILFYRAISGSETFKFSDAIAGDTAYKSIPIPKGTISTTLTGLRPGTRYRVGVLTEIKPGTKTLYSEPNTNILDCVTPMPVATFDQWSRVFAIGPKVDGRFPHSKKDGRVVPEAAKILEAINVDGIPYEVPTDTSGNIIAAGYLRPPGHYHASYTPSTFNDYFDGAFGKNGAVDVAASKNGIVSLGWKDMNLDFLGPEFKECQRHPTDPAITTNPDCATVPALRSGRKYGYKVFRSIDNRLSWQDVTGVNGTSGISLVYARDYKFYKRANKPATTERMAFFTDYSVQAIYTDPEGKERGRILWYKVVPYFEKKPLSISGGGLTTPNIIKVVLPPPNMALVKREMANRNACLEIGRDDTIDKSNSGHYSCAWNGVGGRPKGNPWKVSESIIDLGGDLLVDRFELGCQFTRGSYTSVPQEGQSFFMNKTPTLFGKTHLADFKGFSTSPEGNETGENLQGCTNAQDGRVNLDSNWTDTASSSAPNYKKTIYGDCHGTGTITIASSFCNDPTRTRVHTYKYPGAKEPQSKYDCSNRDDNDPENFADRLSSEFRRHLLIQSEFAAVFYHRDQTKYNMLYPTGPGHVPVVSNTNWWGKQKQCFINLAAIGSDGTVRARWFPAEDLNQIKKGAGIQSFTTRGISETYSDSNLYDTTEYKIPQPSLRSNTRFDDTTPVGKIISANSAKLPPITGISQELAQEYCSAYNIEVGISTDGTNFLATTLPTTKRLLRKVELLAASHWPIASDNDASSYNYTDTRINSLEGANARGNCISSLRQVSNPGMGRDNPISPGFASFDPSNTGLIDGKAITGSSAQDGSIDDHSDKCVSEYGVQDLVGNVSELSPERIFCDYSKDKLWYGVYEGDPFTQSGFGHEDKSVQISDDQSNDRLFWSELTMYFEKPGPPAGPGGFREVGKKANNTLTDSFVGETVAWPQPDTNSGYCSIVDQTESYSQDMTRFRDASDNFKLSTLPGGVLNTAMIPAINETKLDRESVNFLRNGDGAFLNFGTSNIAPQFKDGNSLAINATGLVEVRGSMESMALGPFFNPWVGLPMACKGSSCNESDDNKRITTPYLNSKVGADSPVITDFPVGNSADSPVITDFPVGNSQVNNIGISDVIHTGNANFDKYDFTNQPSVDNDTYIIDQITVYLDGKVEYGKKTLSKFWDDHPEIRGTKQDVSGIRFAIPRWTPLVFTNGGSFNQTTTGRYSSTVVLGSGENTKYTTGPGIRCGVMINSD